MNEIGECHVNAIKDDNTTKTVLILWLCIRWFVIPSEAKAALLNPAECVKAVWCIRSIMRRLLDPVFEYIYFLIFFPWFLLHESVSRSVLWIGSGSGRLEWNKSIRNLYPDPQHWFQHYKIFQFVILYTFLRIRIHNTMSRCLLPSRRTSSALGPPPSQA